MELLILLLYRRSLWQTEKQKNLLQCPLRSSLEILTLDDKELLLREVVHPAL
jgi:hypothetical protein